MNLVYQSLVVLSCNDTNRFDVNPEPNDDCIEREFFDSSTWFSLPFINDLMMSIFRQIGRREDSLVLKVMNTYIIFSARTVEPKNNNLFFYDCIRCNQ